MKQDKTNKYFNGLVLEIIGMGFFTGVFILVVLLGFIKEAIIAFPFLVILLFAFDLRKYLRKK